jgi:DNA-binding IclR family transcriptional regulator
VPEETPSPPPSHSWSRSTERAAAILACFSLEEPRLRVSEIAKRLELHPSSVYRYLEALEAAHLVERDEQFGGYKPGLRIVELSVVVLRNLEVRRQALDEMDGLRDEMGLLVNLGVLRDADVIHVAHAFPVGWPRENMDVGRPAAAHATSLGKVLLASLPLEEAVRRVLNAGWRSYTPHSIQSESSLRTELAKVAESGFAIDEEERNLGIMCVAVPIRAADSKVVAALSATGRSDSIRQQGTDKLAARLTRSAHRISVRMGRSGDMLAYL